MFAASCACALTGWCLFALQSARPNGARPCSLESQPTADWGVKKVKARCRCLMDAGWSWSLLSRMLLCGWPACDEEKGERAQAYARAVLLESTQADAMPCCARCPSSLCNPTKTVRTGSSHVVAHVRAPSASWEALWHLAE